MNCSGFRLVKLRLTGANVADAEVHFKKGLNVICGPSNTGKTFILQCVNFILGGSDKPKEIEEASAYDTIFLTIVSYRDNKEHTLKRSLSGGVIDVTSENKTITYKEKHDKDKEDTISYFLLELSNLEGKRIRTNAKGATQSLSFRNIAHHILVSEEQIYKEASPLLPEKFPSKTTAASIFRLLLSGKDDSSVIDESTDNISKARIEARNELLEDFINKTNEEYSDLNIIGSHSELLEQQEKLEQSYNHTLAALGATQECVNKMEEDREGYLEGLRQTESRLKVLFELKNRFHILEKSYISDIRRLDAIAETGERLMEISQNHCSVCGALSEYHQPEYQEALIKADDVSESCVVEAEKLRLLLDDLQTTKADIEVEIKEKQELKISLGDEFNSIDKKIKLTFKPQVKLLVDAYHESQQRKHLHQKAIELQDRLEEYKSFIEDVVQREKSEFEVSGNNLPPAKNIESFSREVENRLKAWNFPDVERVRFDGADLDIVISGRPRASHGKGVRAITHAAFSLGILGYCRQKEMPNPGFLIIDSPLVVYHEPDPEDLQVPRDVKDSFYTDIATSFADSQIIILENIEPPEQLINSGSLNFIEFTKTSKGRYGFIPIQTDKLA